MSVILNALLTCTTRVLFRRLQNHFVIWSLLTRMHTHPVLVPLQPHISMDIFHPRHLKPLSRRETVESLVSACERWGFWSRTPKSTAEGEGDRAGGVVLMSHSNGSVAHTWVLKDYPTLVRRSAFVDPITFCLWEGCECWMTWLNGWPCQADGCHTCSSVL